MSRITPFTIDVPQDKLDDLRERLGRTIWPSTIRGQQYGGPDLAQMKELTRQAAKLDWRTTEAELNKLPNFMTNIDGQDIHFIHVKSKEPGAIPLLLIHGWPGSVVEFLDHIAPLTAPSKHGAEGAQAFDVVIPSLPGVGFSGPTKDAGWNNGRVGKAFIELMDRLGYPKFALQST
jgi:pimeloyl-ACP methyl ester carboxylesterase